MLDGLRNKVSAALQKTRDTVVEPEAPALVQKVKDAARDAFTEGAKQLAKTEQAKPIVEAFDLKKNITSLAPGDKYKLGYGAQASAEGAKGYQKGSIEVAASTDAAGKKVYTVTVDGEAGAGVYAEGGAKLGLRAGGDASATLGAGSKTELKFDNAADAQKAVEILIKQQAAGASGVLASTDDSKFLIDHISAIEVKGNVAGELAGALGVPLPGKLQADGVFGKTGAKVEQSVRIELPVKDASGKVTQPAQIAVKTTGSAEASGGAGLRLGGQHDKANGKPDQMQSYASSGMVGSGKVTGSVELETRFTLPATIDTAKLLADPKGEVSRHSSEISRSQMDKVTYTGDAVGGYVGGKAKGVETSITFQVPHEKFVSSGIGQKLLDGDQEAALKLLDANSSVTVQRREFTQHGFSLEPGVSVAGFGVGGSLEATRKQYSVDAGSAPRTKKASELLRDFELSRTHPLPVIRPG